MDLISNVTLRIGSTVEVDPPTNINAADGQITHLFVKDDNHIRVVLAGSLDDLRALAASILVAAAQVEAAITVKEQVNV
jgi:hypothetical protein